MRPFLHTAVLSLLLPGCSQGPGSADMAGFSVDLVDVQLRIQQGKAAVDKRGCAMCHQSPNAADGVLAGSLSAVPGTRMYPPNLTPDPDTGLGAWTDAEIIRAFRQGINDEGLDLCWVMPHFHTVGDDEAAAIVAYLRSLLPVHRIIPVGICPPKPGADGGMIDGG